MADLDRIHPQIFRLGAATGENAQPLAFPLGLGACGVHEVCEHTFGDIGALTGFVLASAAMRPGAVAWISQTDLTREHGHLLAGGMRFLRRDLRPVFMVRVQRAVQALWALEEVVASSAVSLAIAELGGVDFTASRRLQLASERHGVPVILMLPYTTEGATAASARWRVRAEPSAPNRYDPRAPGALRWYARLERSRLAPEQVGQGFNLELDDETLSLHMVSGLAAHPASPGKTRRIQGTASSFRRTG